VPTVGIYTPSAVLFLLGLEIPFRVLGPGPQKGYTHPRQPQRAPEYFVVFPQLPLDMARETGQYEIVQALLLHGTRG
jgi:hypothetical protein